jgi:hypothetical protein
LPTERKERSWSTLATPELAAELRQRLLDRRADAPLHFVNDGIWLRISALPSGHRPRNIAQPPAG